MTRPDWRTPAVIITAGSLMLLLNMGARNSFGLFLAPMTSDLGWDRQTFSFAVAIQLLMWGLTQPFAGAIADRFGSGRVVFAGGMIYALGVWLCSVSTDPLAFNISAGLLAGIGMGGTGYAVVLAVMARAVPPERRTFAMGIGTAAGSLGQFLLVPLVQACISAFGWAGAFVVIAMLILLMLPIARAMTGKPETSGPQQSLTEAVTEAMRHPGYLLLTAGYFICGFQLFFIAAHLPAYLVDRGISPGMGAVALALIGLTNIGGCLLFGALGTRRRKKYLLSMIYLARGVLLTGFLLAPLSEISVLVFAALLGVLWLSTVPLTTSLVGQIFGVRYMATLGGVVFFSHQVGSFLGVWLGGLVYDRTGSYDMVWWSTVVLSVVAALLHWPIDDRAVVRSPAPA